MITSKHTFIRGLASLGALVAWVLVGPSAHAGSSLLQISSFEAAAGQPVTFTFTDLGTGATNYQVEFTVSVGPTESWGVVDTAVITDQSGGLYSVFIDTLPGPHGFYRVRGLGGNGDVTASFSTTTFEVTEGATVEPVITFNAPYFGIVRYTLRGTAMTGDYVALSGEVQANGSSVSIPVTLVDDGNLNQLRYLTLVLEAGEGYSVGGAQTSTITIVDNDAEWRGAFESDSGGFTFTLRLEEQNGAFMGFLQSHGLGFFPSNDLPAVVLFTEDDFVAAIDPVPVAANGTSLGQAMNLGLYLIASNGTTNQTVSAEQVMGEARLVTWFPNRPVLTFTNHGSFALLRPPARPNTTKVPLDELP